MIDFTDFKSPKILYRSERTLLRGVDLKSFNQLFITEVLFSKGTEFYVISPSLKLYFTKEDNGTFEVRLYRQHIDYFHSYYRENLPKVNLEIETINEKIFLFYDKKKKKHIFKDIDWLPYLTSANPIIRNHAKKKINEQLLPKTTRKS